MLWPQPSSCASLDVGGDRSAAKQRSSCIVMTARWAALIRDIAPRSLDLAIWRSSVVAFAARCRPRSANCIALTKWPNRDTSLTQPACACGEDRLEKERKKADDGLERACGRCGAVDETPLTAPRRSSRHFPLCDYSGTHIMPPSKATAKASAAPAASSPKRQAAAAAPAAPSPKRQAIDCVLTLSADEVSARVSKDQLASAADALEAAAAAVRARADDLKREEETQSRLDEMVAEAQAWMPSPVPESVLRKLLSGLRLIEMKSETVSDGEDDEGDRCTRERLTLKVYIPERYPGYDAHTPGILKDESQCTHKWHADWGDYYRLGQIAGTIELKPFFEDPPLDNKISLLSRMRLDRDDPAFLAKVADIQREYKQRANTLRDWQLKPVAGLKQHCEGWRRAAEVKVKEIAWEDVARAVCAGVGMLARDATQNLAQFVLKRTMMCAARDLHSSRAPLPLA